MTMKHATQATMRTLRFTVAAAFALVAMPAAAVTYTIHALPGGNSCGATYINDMSVVAGSCNGVAVLWTANGVHVLGKLPFGRYSYASAVNNLGVATGDGDTGNFRPQSWVELANGTLSNIMPNNGGNTHALFIGDNGYIGGFYTKSLGGSPNNWRGAIWVPDKDPTKPYRETDLPSLTSAIDKNTSSALPMDFNQQGQAAGYGSTDTTPQHAVFWNNDATHSIVDLGTLPGDGTSFAWGINGLGQVVGESHPQFTSTAVLWNNDAAHTATALPLPGTENFGSAHAINNLGQILGISGVATLGSPFSVNAIHTVIWRDGGVFDLTSLLDPVTGTGWVITSALGINNLGQIVGVGMLNGVAMPYVMTPQ